MYAPYLDMLVRLETYLLDKTLHEDSVREEYSRVTTLAFTKALRVLLAINDLACHGTV